MSGISVGGMAGISSKHEHIAWILGERDMGGWYGRCDVKTYTYTDAQTPDHALTQHVPRGPDADKNTETDRPDDTDLAE